MTRSYSPLPQKQTNKQILVSPMCTLGLYAAAAAAASRPVIRPTVIVVGVVDGDDVP